MTSPGIVPPQQTCPRCQAPGQRLGRRCPKCGRRYWSLARLLGLGGPMKY